MGKLHSIVRALLIAYIGILLVAAGGAVTLWKWYGVRVYSVQTNSMRPVFRSGDAVLAKPVDVTGLHTGQVISYTSPASPRVIVSHRIVAIDKARGLITTKGDKAQRPDVSFSPNLVKGQVSAVLPQLGFVLDVMHKPIGLAIGVYLPAALVLLSEIKRLASHFGYGYYRSLGLRRA